MYISCSAFILFKNFIDSSFGNCKKKKTEKYDVLFNAFEFVCYIIAIGLTIFVEI